MLRRMRRWWLALLLVGCTRSSSESDGGRTMIVGLVTDVGGRGDQSFNDSALRGLEAWAAAKTQVNGRYVALSDADRRATLPPELTGRITPLGIKPLVVQSRAMEDYEPNLQLIVDQGADLTVGVGFMMENAVEAVARQNQGAKFLLIDSPILDGKGNPQALPNVRSVTFREEEGSFLVGALAAQVAKHRVGFVGGMEIPLIKKFEAGFRAGVHAVNPEAEVLVQYTGSFDNVGHGKSAATDLLSKGCEVVFHAAGSDGVGVIQAVKEAHARGEKVFAIGVDSDQSHLAPDAVLTSMEKRVDLAVWQAAHDLATGAFTAGHGVLGLKEGGVAYAPVKVDFEGKAEALRKVEALKQEIVAGRLQVPTR